MFYLFSGSEIKNEGIVKIMRNKMNLFYNQNMLTALLFLYFYVGLNG